MNAVILLYDDHGIDNRTDPTSGFVKRKTLYLMKKEKAAVCRRRGGYESIIFVPSTPRSLLQRHYHSETWRKQVRRFGKESSTTQRSDLYKERI